MPKQLAEFKLLFQFLNENGICVWPSIEKMECNYRDISSKICCVVFSFFLHHIYRVYKITTAILQIFIQFYCALKQGLHLISCHSVICLHIFVYTT